MKTAGRRTPNRWAPGSSNRAPGAVRQNRSRSIQWAEKQEKFQPAQKCFFLTSPFIELPSTNPEPGQITSGLPTTRPESADSPSTKAARSSHRAGIQSMRPSRSARLSRRGSNPCRRASPQRWTSSLIAWRRPAFSEHIYARLLTRWRMSESGQSIPKSRNARHKTAW